MIRLFFLFILLSPPRGFASEESQKLYESALEVFNASFDSGTFEVISSEYGHRTSGWDMLSRSSMMGHPQSRLIMAWSKLLGLPSNNVDLLDASSTLAEIASTTGEPDAQFGLGYLYATGLTTNSSQAKALLYYTFAAHGGSPLALMALGYRHLSRTGAPSSCETALIYYRKVAETVTKSVNFSSGTMLQRIRLLDEEGESANGFLDSDKIDYYQFLADNGDVQVQVGLGTLYYQGGRGVDKDHSLALKYFTRASEAGNPVAMAYLGKLYLEGVVVEQSDEVALLYFSKSAEALNPIGQTGMGILYLEGRAVKTNYATALAYFQKAAEQNWVEGQLQLGNMYYKGLGVSQNYKTAMKYFFLASQSGHILAYHNLAEIYASGIGTLRSCSIAVELYKNVAERGKWAGLMMSAHTDYKEERYDEAILKYLLLAEAGSEVAQANVAYILDRKESNLFESNEMLKRALVYWSRSAAQGYSAARVRLGDYYYYGLGTSVDFEAAAFHYRIASEQSNAQAMFNLGYMHELGVGMKKDVNLAKRFYDMASESSTDAVVPVSIALAKLYMVHSITLFLENYENLLSPELLNNLKEFWDLYLLGVLFILLGIIFFIRKTHTSRTPPRPNNAPQEH